MGKRESVAVVVCLSVFGAGFWFVQASQGQQQGPLAVVKCDHRTPISTLPFTIERCGSYFLTDCLTGVAEENGITIAADGVTLDLNGFSLMGVPESLDGVAVQGTRSNLRVRNGSIVNWDGLGVQFDNGTDTALNSSVTDVNVTECGSTGIEVIGSLVSNLPRRGLLSWNRGPQRLSRPRVHGQVEYYQWYSDRRFNVDRMCE